MGRLSTIAMLSDFGYQDAYVGIMKAVIRTLNPQAVCVDLCHEIPAQNLPSAAFQIQQSYRFFPPHTIFLCVVDPGVGSHRKAVIVRTKNHLFVGPDNGLFSLALVNEDIHECIVITNKDYYLNPVSTTFHGRDIFAPVAAHLSLGVAPKKFGPPLKTMTTLPALQAHLDTVHKEVHGRIIHIDRFGNCISNISGQQIQNITCQIHIKDQTITSLTQHYCEHPANMLLALVGSSGYVEIAVNQGNAHTQFGIEIGCPITIKASDD